MPANEDILQSYIEKLLDLQDQQERNLSKADLLQTAQALGLSEADLAQAGQIAQTHRIRGDGYAKHGHWAEAIAEYRQAMALHPLNVEAIYALAQAYAQRGNPTDNQEAERLAHRCIALNPKHNASFELLGRLKQPTPSSPPRRRLVIALTVSIGLLLILMVGLVMYFANRPTSVPAPPVVETPSVPRTPASPTPLAVLPNELPSEWEVPVQFIPDQATDLQFSVQQSLLKRFTDSYSHTLQADLVSEKDELHQLKLRMEWVDEAGTVLATHYVEALGENDPYVRPGDVLPIDNLEFEETSAPRLAGIRLFVDRIERQPAPAQYAPMSMVALNWEVANPDLNLSLFERESRIRDNTLFKTWRHRLVLVLHNAGPRSVKKMKVRVDWLDKKGRTLHSKPSYWLTTSAPALLAGQRRVVRVFESFPEDAPKFDRYAIAVVDVE